MMTWTEKVHNDSAMVEEAMVFGVVVGEIMVDVTSISKINGPDLT
jgi:hypothetical protein